MFPSPVGVRPLTLTKISSKAIEKFPSPVGVRPLTLENIFKSYFVEQFPSPVGVRSLTLQFNCKKQIVVRSVPCWGKAINSNLTKSNGYRNHPSFPSPVGVRPLTIRLKFPSPNGVRPLTQRPWEAAWLLAL